LIALAAAAGGLMAVAVREAVISTPALARWLSAAVEPLARAGREGYAPSADEQRRLALLGSAAIFAAAVLVAGPGPLVAFAIAGPAAAAWAVSRRRRRYRRAVERHLPEVATAIADAISAGHSVRGALGSAVSSLQGPPAAELARATAELELGASTAEVLAALRHRLRSPRVNAFTAALASQQVAGGDLAGLLRRFADAATDQDRATEDARAATTQARFTGLLVVALPVGAALFAELLEPGFAAGVISDPVGVTMLALAVALQALGFGAIRRLGRPAE
jgi:tight adherence protein B